MSDLSPKNQSGSHESLPARVPKQENILDAALAQLPEEQRLALVQKALEERIAIDAAAKKADMRLQASAADMDKTMDLLRETERSTKSDYRITGDFETASGRTNIEIKKQNNLAIIVIAIVFGVIVLFLFSHGK